MAITEINVDTIMQLRLSGQAEKATILLREYHKDVTQAKKILANRIERELRLEHKQHGLCSRPYCLNFATEGYVQCSPCREYHKASIKRWRQNELRKRLST